MFRFHLLQEFDEGKRSCRRRLAGHNRRRRKTHPEVPGSANSLIDERASSYLLISLLRILSNLQGNFHAPLTVTDFVFQLCLDISCGRHNTQKKNKKKKLGISSVLLDYFANWKSEGSIFDDINGILPWRCLLMLLEP